MEEGAPRCLVLDIEKEFMKFNKDFIVRNKAIDKEQISAKFSNKKTILSSIGVDEPGKREWPTCVIDKLVPLATCT